MANKPDPQLLADLELLKLVAKQAGEIALSYFKSENQIWEKSGGSPVSAADFAVDKFLREKLLNERQQYGWLSEETEDDKEARLSRNTIFVVDPIDGTRGYLEGKAQWCISIAIVKDNKPVVGVLECPALKETYWAMLGGGSFLNGTKLLLPSNDPITGPANSEVKTITGSRALNVELAEGYKDRLEILPFVPSLAYRIAMVAANVVDAGIARGGASDWDLAAADLILSEAGGLLTDLNGNLRHYNKQSTGGGPLVAASNVRHNTILGLAKTEGFLQ